MTAGQKATGMAKEIVFHHRDSNWTDRDRIHQRGTVLVGDQVIGIDDLEAMLSGVQSLEALGIAMKDLNGFYSIVIRGNEDIVMAVDRMRSYPLFYGSDDQALYCSDDPFWIQDQLGDRSLDPIAQKEFRLSGYVTRDRTLSPRIKQLRSGEVARLSLEPTSEVRVQTAPYQKYKPGDYSDQELEPSLKQMDHVMVASFQRLIDLAAGRTLMVPLSGGYDSRLIVLMLKKLGYENIIAFSYGRSGNPESIISKDIAERLGIRWEFIEYNNERWLRWYQSEENWAYYPMGSNLTSLPHIQDWPAVKMLKEDGRIPKDAIFVPGHTIANPSQYANLQRHSVKEAEAMPKYKIATAEGAKDVDVGFPVDKLVNDLITDNYNLPGQPIKEGATLREMRALVLSALDNVSGYDDYVSAYEYWNFNERQVKFIFNSIRIYEYWGYQWWMPLLDKELMDFWRTLSLDLRHDKQLIRVYTDRLSVEMMKGFQITHYQRTLQKKGYRRLVSVILKNKSISKFMGMPYNYMKKRRMYDTEPQAYFGMLTKERYNREYTGKEYINYFTAADFIDWISKRSPR
jgi:asparagine synthase (glutamine-hydrolysing)